MPHQSVLLLSQDELAVEVHVAKVLCYGEATQTVTGVVEISGPGGSETFIEYTTSLWGHVWDKGS